MKQNTLTDRNNGAGSRNERLNEWETKSDRHMLYGAVLFHL